METNMNQTFTTSCDMGSVKIFDKANSFFFDNGIGDVPTEVTITDEKTNDRDYIFLGHFTVKQKNKVHLSSYDCSDDKIFTFPIGRWFVYLIKDAEILIVYQDNDIHA